MTNAVKRPSRTFVRSTTSVLALAIVFVLAVVASGSAQAQTFTVLYTFTNTADGEQPDASLFLDATGNLYGTTQYGGAKGGFGTVFKVNTKGEEVVLRSFAGTPDAEDPYAGLTRDKAGNFYGTTLYGGTQGGFGTVFKLHAGKETILHSFAGTPDGEDPRSVLVRDAAGNLYGTTQYGGTNGGYGTVFKLDANGKLTLLYSFAGTPDGDDPYAGLLRDKAGNLYGTTQYGGTNGGYGTVFKLSPKGKVTLLHSFAGTPDGVNPLAGLLLDGAGNLYGTTYYGGTNGGFGTVFKLSTKGKLTLLHSFAGMPDGQNPYARLIRDAAGNLYGATFYGGTSGYGTVFKLDTGGKLTVLHSFNDAPDGAHPIGGLVLDKAGNLYGTTSDGGDLRCGFSGCGTVFKLTP
ncbi:MAG TPA: choice-of-anchor tandem repeat GloVer-containing protein [Terriglobales bacterium]|jgi:uncharacterized repeat protein (TIGR03803 family)|nr:choice-of-anchor tandem repeat GloVer-containing protein [Terriglobales bacterium]